MKKWSSFPFPDGEFFRAVADALVDFSEVNQVTPLNTLFEVRREE
jgi:hypothetical protein